ncbi:TerB N-terminal domain-containing protein [Paenibacillus pini]
MIEFTEIEILETIESVETQGTPIPPRSSSIPPKEEIELDLSPVEEFPFYTKEHEFLLQATEWTERVEDEVPFVPFMSYWPTYDEMMESQLKWYFYWRSEVRKERYLDNDLSYVFVYIYELINGIGWDKPEEGYALLLKIWESYRARYRQLNGYLADWVSDFVLVHGLDIPLIDILAQSQTSLKGELLNIELLRMLKEEPSRLTLEMLSALSDYDMFRSKFYNSTGRLDLELYIPKVIALVDSYMLKTNEVNLINMLHPGEEKTVERYLFRSAMYDPNLYGRTVMLTCVPLQQYLPLRVYVTQLFKYTENILRELRGFKGRLRGIELEPEVKKLIKRYVTNEFTRAKKTPPSISIDSAKLTALQLDTEVVRNMLTIEDENETAKPTGIEIKMDIESEIENEQLSTKEIEYTDNEPMQLDTQVPNMLESSPLQVNSGNEHEIISWNTEGMDEEWQLFASLLSTSHLDILATLMEKGPYHGLSQVAEAHGTMPALLIDEINEASMETIGDLVIDGEQIMDEYISYFKNLK